MADPHQPDFSLGMPSAQTFRCCNGILAKSIVSAVNVNGNDLPLVAWLNEMADVLLVNLFSKAGSIFGGPALPR